jgi:ankyrin repeat protein
VQKVESLSKDEELIDGVDRMHRSALHFAAMSGCSDAVDLLVKHADIDPAKEDDSGLTPMATAAFNGHTELAISLFEAGNGDEHVHEEEFALLCGLSANGDLDGVKRLLEGGLNLKDMFSYFAKKTGEGLPPVIHFAAAGGSLTLVKYLAKKGFSLGLEVCEDDPDVCDTAFASAVRHGRLDVAKHLVKKGVSFHKPVESWNVDMHIELANSSGSPEMLAYLLKLKKKYKKKYKE